MRANTSGRFYDEQRAAVQGGTLQTKDMGNWASYVYRSPVGVDVYIVAHPAMPGFTTYGSGSNLNATRCVAIGKGGICVAPGRESKDVGSFSWHERAVDEGNQTRVTTGVVTGLQKPAYNTTETGTTREDYAIVAIDTYCNY
jgi:hypothetical protein